MVFSSIPSIPISSLSPTSSSATSRSSSSQSFIHQYPRRSLLPSRSSCLWRIECGVVRAMTWRRDGTVVPLGIWQSGDVVGEGLTQSANCQIEALTDVSVTAIAFQDWQPVPEELLSHLKQAHDLMIIRSGRRSDEILLDLLTWLAKRFGQPVNNGTLIALKLTHQDLADFSGLTRVTVTRTLSMFEQNHVIHRLSRQLVLAPDAEVWHYEI
ncbi:Crp/Fnr family transcriptional regulator [Leptolyngbya sp. AN02str]|uniref:Crp/Fnr family transcriptional regulator n=1 Tax=Leptolyngbya sp. AN02str TaxID=3423363 RepID=UPI003D312833